METLPGVQHIKGIAHKILIGAQPTDGSVPNLKVLEQHFRASQLHKLKKCKDLSNASRFIAEPIRGQEG